MKKSIRTIAAALAAIMAMSTAAISSYAIYTGEPVDYADGEMHIMTAVAGGWEVNESMNISLESDPDAKAAFEKATSKLMGVDYTAIGILGKQVVAGTNYAILCRSTVVYPDAQPEMKIMYIYADLQGNAEVTGFQTIIGEQLMGGFTANAGKLALSKNPDVKKAYKKAMEGLAGADYIPAALLGSQVVAGTNYMILCRSQVVYPGAPYQWSLVKVNKDLEGKASLVDIETLELGHSFIDGAEEENEEEMFVQTANPWSEYASIAEAATAAGVEFTAPDALGEYKLSYIQAMKDLVDLRYKKGESVICVRKGKGTDDVSGDYNTYDSVSEKKIGKYTVTVKGSKSGINNAIWTDGTFSYSIVSDDALTEKFVESIISALK